MPSTSTQQAHEAIDWIEGLAKDLSLSFQPVKTICPTTCLEFLGLELDSLAMEAHLPQDKLSYLQAELRTWSSRKHCTLKQVKELIGFFHFCAQVIPHGHTFIRGIIYFSMTFKCKFALRHIPAYARADIRWWLGYAQSWNGIQVLTKPWPTLHVYMDTSGLKGLGGIFRKEWFSSRCPCCFRSRDIQFKEI